MDGAITLGSGKACLHVHLMEQDYDHLSNKGSKIQKDHVRYGN